jgi:DTW domain-containing protein YfiP
MTSFLHDIPNYYANRCEGCNEPRDLCVCTKEIWPISVSAESRMVVMIDRNGIEKQPVIRGSFVHRLWKSNGYTEKKGDTK